MLVVLINESAGKAWKRTRRVLAKYLPQIGSRVWAGHISEEGLKDLYQETKKIISKSGSVTCHRMLNRNRMALQWIAGKKDFYDEQGRYAFRTTKANKDFTSHPQGPYRELLYLTRSLAALLHDIGKATQAFQGKIYGTYHYEEYRHDLVGFLMLRSRFEKENEPEDKVFLETLIKEQIIWPDPKLLFELPQNNPNLTEISLKAWLLHAPVFSLISWLVLTHHRLPKGYQNIEVKETHVNVNKNERKVAPIKESQQAADDELPWKDRNWCAQVARLAKKTLELLEKYPALKDDLKKHSGDWILANVHYSRPLLIAADHLASIQCNQSGIMLSQNNHEKSGTKIAYANKKKQEWGDTVPQHLRRVEKTTRKLKALLQNKNQFRSTILPASSLARLSILPESPYYWQQLMTNEIKKNQDNHPVFAAILAETGSGKTLAGVRLIQAISPKDEQGNSQLRYTLALGLRALTLQSAEALRNQAKIHTKDFVTLVGGICFNLNEDDKKEDDKNKKSANISCQDQEIKNSKEESNEKKESNGMENTRQYDKDLWAEGGEINSDPNAMPWLDYLDATMNGDTVGKRDRNALFTVAKEWLGERGLQLLDTPVVACTVDHIVPATHATCGGDARMALRIFTSDLVLDEIDNYSAQDLITLGKLCFMVGLAGRHVVLMSATMSPFLVQGLFDAWWRGLSIKAKMDSPNFNVLSPPSVAAKVIFVSNQKGVEVQCHEVQTKPDFDIDTFFKEIYNSYVKKVCKGISDANEHRRNMQLLPLPPLVESKDKINHLKQVIYAEILASCEKLHQQNAQNINNFPDVRVSVGFIRFNTAKQAWLYSQWLLKRHSEQDSFSYRVVCYHAKHPRLVLGLMDHKLNQLNNRKEGSNWDVLPELQTALQTAKAANKKDLLIIVVTTTLQETGRDHDYDWAIFEPRSTRGEVQAAGRVRRHRKENYEQTNVYIMSQPLRAFNHRYDAQKDNFFLWGMPGIENAKVKVHKPLYHSLKKAVHECGIRYEDKPESKKVDLAQDALPIEIWQTQGFNAKLCLSTTYSYDENPIGSLEHVENFIKLSRKKFKENNGQPSAQSLKIYLLQSPEFFSVPLSLPLTRVQYDLNRFRENYTQVTTIYCCHDMHESSSQSLADTLFKKLYQRDSKEESDSYKDTKAVVIELSTESEEKVFFYKLFEDVNEYIEKNKRYRPQNALFCELNYRGELSAYKIKYHWALGYFIDKNNID